ncbi:hypothetical protein GGI02_000656 [Coemansia sp. RSA 2322]|nr:hypothetical protein GGI02_000656 [Coemansia sp. RSA 2322]
MTTSASIAAMAPEQRVSTVFQLLQNATKQHYPGEKVTLLEHALQIAHRAKAEGADEETILAALLHDIGHLCPEVELGCGTADVTMTGGQCAKPASEDGAEHERRGAEYLRQFGFSEKVCELVECHFLAKRYLSVIDPAYQARLSSVNKQSLKSLGGPFSPEEVLAFERDPLFKQMVLLSKWDDESDIAGPKAPTLDTYRDMAVRNLKLKKDKVKDSDMQAKRNSGAGVGARTNLFGKSQGDIVKIAEEMGLPSFRGRQIYEWIYSKGATLFQDMANLPKSLQEGLEQTHCVDYGKILENALSVDGTRKMLVQFRNDSRAAVETVFIPESQRGTLCVSSQVGCSLSCTFCHTGTQSLYRNLSAAEIAGQYMIAAWMAKDLPRKVNHRPSVSNIVFMGQGEPLYNFRNVGAAIKLLTDQDGVGVAPWRITISTSGIAPLIPRIATELRVGLAISLHAADNDLRTEIMPINKTYPLSMLMNSCAEFARLAGPQNRRITFEYVMLDGVNDSDQHARQLVDLISTLPAHVNLIPFNPWPGSVYQSSSPARVAAFCSLVRNLGIHASVRTPRGDDILAACGQLKSAHETTKTPTV